MNPKIIGTKQSIRLGANAQPVQVLIVTWTASDGNLTFGPFDEESSWADLSSGVLQDKLRQKAMLLSNLPLGS